MREAADLTRIERFMRALGDHVREGGRVYLTGGATAVLHGWRSSTIDVDVKFVPDSDEFYRALPQLPFIRREGRVSFHHFDLCAQVLAKIERGHEQDVRDVADFLNSDLVTRAALRAYFEAIEPQLYRYPALDPARFRERVRRIVETG